jgi:putative quorum-sensing-regulated virulence factor
MPFGRYAGWPLGEIPDTYITWLIDLPDLRPPLAGVRREAEARGLLPPAVVNTGPVLRFDRQDANTVKALIDAGFRSLSRTAHPDVGGDHAAMVRLNHVVGELRAQLLQIGAGQ